MKYYVKPEIIINLRQKDVLTASIDEKDNFMGFDWGILDEL